MSSTTPLSRVFAAMVAALTVLGVLAALGLTTAPAADAAVAAPAAKTGPAVKIKTKGPYKKNQTVKVKLIRFPANTQVAVGFCPHKSVPTGPGDCGAPGKGYSRLTATNAQGKLVTTLRVPKGKLGATLRPTAKCNNKKKNKCAVHASVIGGATIAAKTKAVRYR
jgi:hypothetical protein